MGLSPQFGRREFLPVAQSLPPRGLPTAVSSQAQPSWVGQLSDERLQAPEWPSVAWKAHGGSAAGAHSLQSLVSGEILGGEPHIAARLSQTRRWRPGEPEGPVQGGKHRAEVEPCGPGPRGWTQECASIQGCSGAGGGRGGLPAPRWAWCWCQQAPLASVGQELPEDKTASGQRTCPRATPPWGRGSESRGPLWDSRAERESLSVSQPGVWDFSSCCP